MQLGIIQMLRSLLILLTLTTLIATFIPRLGEASDVSYEVYLPTIRHPAPDNIFGLEMNFLLSSQGFDLLRTSGTYWIRRNAILWKDIEPIEGDGYRWDALRTRSLEQDFLNASRDNLEMVLVVRGSPQWAVAPYTSDCAPVNEAKWGAFASFMAALVDRYSRPPYNVQYWEIGNEPDAFVFAQDSPFGCWGQPEDIYYGGEYYGRALITVAKAMKQVNPDIKILNGGLLLYHIYDPSNPETTRSGRFFEGVLRSGAGEWIDIVSFHNYINYAQPGQPALGPSVDLRIVFLRNLLARYGFSEKPLIRTETALLCVEITPECRWAQADLVARTFARALRDDLVANIWYRYESDSYHNTALIEPGDVFVPRPAYFAYRHAAAMLSSAEYLGPLEGQDGSIEAYRFRKANETIIVFWTDSSGTVQIPIPVAATVRCTDRDGGAVACPVQDSRIQLPAYQSPQFVTVIIAE
jgi:hypothetical protein